MYPWQSWNWVEWLRIGHNENADVHNDKIGHSIGNLRYSFITVDIYVFGRLHQQTQTLFSVKNSHRTTKNNPAQKSGLFHFIWPSDNTASYNCVDGVDWASRDDRFRLLLRRDGERSPNDAVFLWRHSHATVGLGNGTKKGTLGWCRTFHLNMVVFEVLLSVLLLNCEESLLIVLLEIPGVWRGHSKFRVGIVVQDAMPCYVLHHQHIHQQWQSIDCRT